MEKYLKALPLVFASALMAMTATANAETVVINGIGSSALFLEAGLAASTSTKFNATCVWTSNNNASSSPSNVVTASDTSTGSTLTDKGNAWVVWTTGTRGTCAAPAADSQVRAYLQTDSVVGDRCLFNAHVNGSTGHPECTITYPTGTPASADLLFPANDPRRTETPLPASIASALNAAKVNVAGTDIRPEDAWFATQRALTACGTPVASGSQYLGLGYSNGSNIVSSFSSSVFHVINFSLPNAPSVGYTVTPVGATPILVVINGQSTTSGFGAHTFSNISSENLALFLNGTSTKTDQATNPNATTGNPVTTLIREPLSGTFNTMEYNVPNRTASGFHTSQEAKNCPVVNPLNGPRKRAIGTGQELSEVINPQNGDTLGYAFWSVANFAGFTSAAAPHARYLTVDDVDPLINVSANHNGIIPLEGNSDMVNVTLNNINQVNPNYPIWSLIRFVTLSSDTVGTSAAQDLATATQGFVTFGTSSSRPDFIAAPKLSVVRSHFVPPAPSTQPHPAANGHVGNDPKSACTNTEVGGDVGGVVLSLTADSTTCSSQPTGSKVGTTGDRR